MAEHSYSIIARKVSVCGFWMQQGVTLQREKFTRSPLMLPRQDAAWSRVNSPDLTKKDI